MIQFDLKFRVYDNNKKEYSDLLFLINGDGEVYHYIGGNLNKVSSYDYSVERYTEKKDISNKEIYDGDIIQFTIPELGKVNGTVIWRNAEFQVISMYAGTFSLSSIYKPEIIGNIHM